MTQSCTKRILNEIRTLETDSVFTIPPDAYYIIKIKLEAVDNEFMRKVSEKLAISDPQPSSIFCGRGVLLLIFSPVMLDQHIEGDLAHQLSGNHNLIVSKYVRMMCKQFPNAENITVEMIHLSSKTKVFAYLSSIVFLEYHNAFSRLSNGKITQKEMNFRTESELKELILQRCNVDMDNVDPIERYGELIRMKRVKGKVTYARLSEPFDARDIKKYTGFIFG